MARLLRLALASLAAAALAAGAPARAAAPAPDAERAEARARELFEALQEDRSVRAVKTFAPALRAELPPARLSAAWKRLTASAGRLQAWKLDPSASGDARRVYDLALERGRARATLELSADGAVTAFSVAPPLRPAQAPAGARAAEIAVGALPVQVPGTLVLPGAAGRVPAALLLGDVGADRDGARDGRPPVLRDLAEALAGRGVASLRIERRSAAWPAGAGDDAGLEPEVLADAVAALRQLRARPEVDGARILVVGHGLGAMLAPEVAARGGGAAALVLAGAPARALPLALLEETRASGRLAPGSMAQYQRLAERALANRLEEGERFEGHGDAFWRELATKDPLGELRRLGRPALVVRGEGDLVAAAEEAPAWASGLAGVDGARVETLPGLDHHLAQTGAARASPAALKQVADFLLSALAAASAELPAAAAAPGRPPAPSRNP
jgi:pimeloyl-ACP methyl ester carboxylesterase